MVIWKLCHTHLEYAYHFSEKESSFDALAVGLHQDTLPIAVEKCT